MPPEPAARPSRSAVVAAVLGAALAVTLGIVALRAPGVVRRPSTVVASPSADPDLEELVERALEADDLDAARKTGMHLRAVGEPALAVVSRLRAALAESSASRRATAAILLGRMGAAGTDAIPELAKALADPDGRVRQEAALALGYMGHRAAPAVGSLVLLLHDETQSIRLAAVSALGEIGPGAAAAIAELERLAQSDPDTLVRVFAAAAIKKIGPRPGSPPAGNRV